MSPAARSAVRRRKAGSRKKNHFIFCFPGKWFSGLIFKIVTKFHQRKPKLQDYTGCWVQKLCQGRLKGWAEEKKNKSVGSVLARFGIASMVWKDSS